MVDTVVIDRSAETAGPTLEESAKALGIDPAQVDASVAEQTAPERPAVPEYVPEKFRNAEDPLKAMADAYAELEKKLSKGQKNEAPTERKESEAEGETADEDAAEQTVEEAAQEAVEKAGLDLDKLSEKYWETGALEDSDYTALEQAGYPKHMVDEFIEGRRAVVELQRQSVFAQVGGEENYSSMINWARDNLTDTEIVAYDKAVNGDDMNTVLMAVKGLKARYEAEAGIEPARTVTAGRARVDGSVYESIAELQEDIRNPKYSTDPAFRKRVEVKLARSPIL